MIVLIKNLLFSYNTFIILLKIVRKKYPPLSIRQKKKA